jgi:hypothetical protein
MSACWTIPSTRPRWRERLVGALAAVAVASVLGSIALALGVIVSVLATGGPAVGHLAVGDLLGILGVLPVFALWAAVVVVPLGVPASALLDALVGGRPRVAVAAHALAGAVLGAGFGRLSFLDLDVVLAFAALGAVAAGIGAVVARRRAAVPHAAGGRDD